MFNSDFRIASGAWLEFCFFHEMFMGIPGVLFLGTSVLHPVLWLNLLSLSTYLRYVLFPLIGCPSVSAIPYIISWL